MCYLCYSAARYDAGACEREADENKSKTVEYPSVVAGVAEGGDTAPGGITSRANEMFSDSHGLWVECSVDGSWLFALAVTHLPISLLHAGVLTLTEKGISNSWKVTIIQLRSVTSDRVRAPVHTSSIHSE